MIEALYWRLNSYRCLGWWGWAYLWPIAALLNVWSEWYRRRRGWPGLG